MSTMVRWTARSLAGPAVLAVLIASVGGLLAGCTVAGTVSPSASMRTHDGTPTSLKTRENASPGSDQTGIVRPRPAASWRARKSMPDASTLTATI